MSLPKIKLRVGDVYELTDDPSQPLKLIGRRDELSNKNKLLTTKEVKQVIGKTLKEVSIFEKEVWNAAIEKAALEVRINTTGDWALPLLEKIRKLKV